MDSVKRAHRTHTKNNLFTKGFGGALQGARTGLGTGRKQASSIYICKNLTKDKHEPQKRVLRGGAGKRKNIESRLTGNHIWWPRQGACPKDGKTKVKRPRRTNLQPLLKRMSEVTLPQTPHVSSMGAKIHKNVPEGGKQKLPRNTRGGLEGD